MDVAAAPELAVFTSRLAEMHKISQSPTGNFGFHVATCDGKIAHTVEWEESWAFFYQKLLRDVCKLDLETNGRWPELERATEQVATKVVPLLLGALQAEGRQIKPSIIHGDLWDGNIGINMETVCVSGDLRTLSPCLRFLVAYARWFGVTSAVHRPVR